MKTKKLGLFMLCLVLVGVSMEISAQNHLDALIKKCETLKSVDMEVVMNKRKTQKEDESKTVRIRITNDKKLITEFLDALKKDSQNAEQSTDIREKNGEIIHFWCKFPKQTYTITIKKGEDAIVTVGNNDRYQFQERMAQHQERMAQHQERMKQHQVRVAQHQEQVKQHQEQTKVRMAQHQEKMKLHKEQVKVRMKQHQERMKEHQEKMKLHQEQMKQHQERIKQYKSNKLDSMFLRHNVIADSLILKSATRLNSINWDSITSKFGKDIDSVINKLGVGWDEVLEKYEFE